MQPTEITENHYRIEPIGIVHSDLTNRGAAPRQGYEGAPDAWLEMTSTVADGLDGLAVGDQIITVIGSQE
jgi:tRNA (Thr-GGU) A37 N-methylase